ncbi:hypothetical protein DSL72_001285 [Monilinia vaccinii-corymbosi]|uniref:Peroxin/Ferlin domain-containing protein n=1 Tax=Monilinia vaccinii-corymbosi TaxID=61207 RepID=A0A8A3P964_9HELO|nr:hypothetical protein DSL72_001285 [Monilinia vaccinii-corymbosi]
MSLLRSKYKRPEALTDADYDHEIQLVDRTDPGVSQVRSRSRSRSTQARVDGLPAIVITDSSSRDQTDGPLRRKLSLRAELTKRKWKKYRDAHVAADEIEESPVQGPSVITLPPTNEHSLDGEDNRGRRPRRTKAQQERDNLPFEIDILYQNERGLILCGLRMFSGQALGNLDPAPWTNIANKTSATNTSNAQVPDPSWEWAWPEWIINHDDGVDDEGWEYSFAFSKKWSWHNAKWYSSFVRRRVWIRKRVKRGEGYHSQHAHMLNDDYFTIHPARGRSRGATLTGGGAHDGDSRSRHILAVSSRNFETEWRVENISDIATLMKVLRICRIDREKLEAVDSFIKHGGEELHYLTEVEQMRDIMNHFIFQASRRVLLGRLMKEFEGASAENGVGKGNENDEKGGGDDKKNDDNDKQRQRAKTLEAAVKAADEEVKRLEYWSDVRHMAEKGETMGAVSHRKGWDGKWEGLDASGPKSVKFDGEVLRGEEVSRVEASNEGIGGKENREENGNANGN